MNGNSSSSSHPSPLCPNQTNLLVWVPWIINPHFRHPPLNRQVPIRPLRNIFNKVGPLLGLLMMAIAVPLLHPSPLCPNQMRCLEKTLWILLILVTVTLKMNYYHMKLPSPLRDTFSVQDNLSLH